MYLTNAGPCMPLKSTRLECRHFFYNFLFTKLYKRNNKNNNSSQSTALYFNDRQIFHIHTVAFQSQDTQYELCIKRRLLYYDKNAWKGKLTMSMTNSKVRVSSLRHGQHYGANQSDAFRTVHSAFYFPHSAFRNSAFTKTLFDGVAASVLSPALYRHHYTENTNTIFSPKPEVPVLYVRFASRKKQCVGDLKGLQ